MASIPLGVGYLAWRGSHRISTAIVAAIVIPLAALGLVAILAASTGAAAGHVVAVLLPLIIVVAIAFFLPRKA